MKCIVDNYMRNYGPYDLLKKNNHIMKQSIGNYWSWYRRSQLANIFIALPENLYVKLGFWRINKYPWYGAMRVL